MSKDQTEIDPNCCVLEFEQDTEPSVNVDISDLEKDYFIRAALHAVCFELVEILNGMRYTKDDYLTSLIDYFKDLDQDFIDKWANLNIETYNAHMRRLYGKTEGDQSLIPSSELETFFKERCLDISKRIAELLKKQQKVLTKNNK